MKVSGRHVSMDAPFANGEESSLLDVLVNFDSPKADTGLMNESLSKEIDRALSSRNDLETDQSSDLLQGAAWLSSARAVRCWVKSRNERNPITSCHQVTLGTLVKLPS